MEVEVLFEQLLALEEQEGDDVYGDVYLVHGGSCSQKVRPDHRVAPALMVILTVEKPAVHRLTNQLCGYRLHRKSNYIGVWSKSHSSSGCVRR